MKSSASTSIHSSLEIINPFALQEKQAVFHHVGFDNRQAEARDRR